MNKPCPEFARTSAFTHAANLIPSRVAGSTAVGAAMIRAPKDRALTLDDFQGRGIYKTISNDYDEEIHRRIVFRISSDTAWKLILEPFSPAQIYF